jgi:hypothetical protein
VIIQVERERNILIYNDEDYETMMKPDPTAPFPDIAAKALGIIIEHKFNAGVNKVNQLLDDRNCL